MKSCGEIPYGGRPGECRPARGEPHGEPTFGFTRSRKRAGPDQRGGVGVRPSSSYASRESRRRRCREPAAGGGPEQARGVVSPTGGRVASSYLAWRAWRE